MDVGHKSLDPKLTLVFSAASRLSVHIRRVDEVATIYEGDGRNAQRPFWYIFRGKAIL